MKPPIQAERSGPDTLRADCPFCEKRHDFLLNGRRGVMGWFYVWSQCDVPSAFRSERRHRRKYLVLRVAAEGG